MLLMMLMEEHQEQGIPEIDSVSQKVNTLNSARLHFWCTWSLVVSTTEAQYMTACII